MDGAPGLWGSIEVASAATVPAASPMATAATVKSPLSVEGVVDLVFICVQMKHLGGQTEGGCSRREIALRMEFPSKTEFAAM